MRHACTIAIARYTYGMATFGIRLFDPKMMFRQFAKQQWFGILGTGLPYPVYGRFSTTSDGHRMCTALVLGDPRSTVEIRSRQLRDIPLTQISEAANRGPLRQLLGIGPQLRNPYRPRHPGPAGHDDAHYEKVLAEYLMARRSSETPIKRVANRLGCSVATVHRYLNEAEDRGMKVPVRRRRKS